MSRSFSPSRRRMLKNLSYAAAASMLPYPSLAAHLSKPPQAQDKLGVALVGLGNYSNLMLGPALKETQRCELRGLVSGSPDKVEKWSREFSIPKGNTYSYDNFDEIADNPDIDIVYVVLPNFLHAEYTIRAAKAGKHVICEKPMAMNPKECEQMIQACKEAGVLLSVGYRLHYEPHHLEMMRLGKEKPFGPINFIEGGLAYHLRDPKLWRLDKAKGGGGALMDLGVYPLQATRYVTGEEPIAITAQGFTHDTSRFKDIYESVLWQMEFPSGTIANCTTSYSSWVDRLHVSCYRGWFGLNPSFGGRGSAGETSKGPLSFPKVNQQAAHMDDFALSIQEDQPLRVSGEEGLKDMRIIQAIFEAADSGEKVQLV